MILSKKWKFYLFGFVLLTACKSADCGCPIAEKTIEKAEMPAAKKEFNKVVFIENTED